MILEWNEEDTITMDDCKYINGIKFNQNATQDAK